MIDLNLFSIDCFISVNLQMTCSQWKIFCCYIRWEWLQSEDLGDVDDNLMLIIIFIYFVERFVTSDLHLLNIRSYICVWFSLSFSEFYYIKNKNKKFITFYVYTNKLYYYKNNCSKDRDSLAQFLQLRH